MDKDVLITISGIQFSPAADGEEPVALSAPGKYFFRDGKHYIMYDELLEPENVTTHNTLKICADKVELIKNGAVNVKMEFEKGKKALSCYNLPFGSLMLGTTAKNLEITENDDRIKAKIDYALEINYEHAADCVIDIDVVSKESGEFRIFD